MRLIELMSGLSPGIGFQRVDADRLAELQRALAASPGKEDHAILLSLRNAVNSYIDTQKLSLQALKDAVSPVPQSPTRPEN